MNYLLAVLALLLFIALIVTYRAKARLQRWSTFLNSECIAKDKAHADLERRRQTTQTSADFWQEEGQRLGKELRSEYQNSARKVKEARKDAVKRATAVAHGFESENFAPLIQDQWNHKDFRHMGDPIDFVVFAGMEEVRNNKAGTPLEEVVLLDIKTGSSGLSTLQRRIRDAVVAKRVSFAVYNTDSNELRTWPAKVEETDLQLELTLKEKK